MLVSSADITPFGEASRMQLGSTLKKNNGPNIFPSGTPKLTVRVVDSLPFMLHPWVRLLNYD